MPTKYTKEIIQQAVNDSLSWAEVCRKLKIKPFTGAQCNLTKRAKDYNIDYSHFTGKLWSKGRKDLPKISIEDYFNNVREIKSACLRERLIKEGYKEFKCELCNNKEWNGFPIPLELDHKNSDHWDNKLSNLQIICPNCHALETHKRKLDKKLNK